MKTRRPRDLLYDAWVEVWGEPQTTSERGRLNRALKELREIGASPAEVRRVLASYDREFRNVPRSPQGVTRNWSALLAATLRRSTQVRDVCHHGVSFFVRCPECEA
jgi:hypothetical protein